MTDFSSNLTPIAVPSLASATADALAQFQAGFASNIVVTGNSLLQNYIALKDTDFFSVGDIPVLGPQLLALDGQALITLDTRPVLTQPATDWTTLEHNLDQLAALSVPSVPSLQTITTDVPVLDAAAPTITLPVPPTTDVGAAPGNAPDILDATLPDAPVITLPAVPTFDELQLPTAPTFDLPSFTAVAPQNLLSPPTAQFSYVDPGYTSVLHDPLVQKLLLDLQNGSYGIDANDESALWFRARDRAAQQARDAVTEAQRRMASTSFPMPQGAMLEAIDQAEQKAQTVLSEANREIALRRSELYVEGRKFTIQQVKEYEQVRISLYNATQERALNYSKALVDTSIALYDANVRNFQAQLDAYKTEAQVFEQRTRAELTKAELFRAQVEAEKLRVDFNRAKLDLFNGQLAAITTTVELYKSRLTAANVFMQIQGQRLEVFRNQVVAYSERIRAKEAEYHIYEAQVKGQLASLDIYKSQIEAYNSRLAGIDTKGRIQLQSNESLLQAYKAATQNYASQLESFTKQVASRLDEAKAKGVYYGLDVEAYRAYTTAAAESAKVRTELNKYNLDWNRAALASRVAQIEFRLKQLGLSVELQKDVNSHGVDFLRGALTGAVSGLNSLGVSSQ